MGNLIFKRFKFFFSQKNFMNKNSQESESKPIFKRRLKRFDKITDDEDKVPNSAGVSKNNTLQEKLMETANGDIEETSEPKTAFSSKV